MPQHRKHRSTVHSPESIGSLRSSHRRTRGLVASVALLVTLSAVGCVDDPLEPSGPRAEPAGIARGGDAVKSLEFVIVEDLNGKLGGSKSQANAINDAKQITGWRATPQTTKMAYVYGPWSGSVDLGTLGKVPFTSEGHDISNDGIVAGQASDRAFVWSAPGPMKELADDEATVAKALGIADVGEIVGMLRFPDPISGFRWDPVAWSDGAGTPQHFEVPIAVYQTDLARYGQAFDVNEQRHVVGRWADTRAFHVDLDDPNPGTGFTTLQTLPSAMYSTAHALNDDGIIAGTIMKGNRLHAVRWPGRWEAPELLGTLGGSWSQALDINNDGTIVGIAEDSHGRLRAYRLPPSGLMEELPVPYGASTTMARGINNDGDIVGFADFGPGNRHAVVWWRYHWKYVPPLKLQAPSGMSIKPEVVKYVVLSVKEYRAGELDPSTITLGDGRGADIGVMRSESGEYAVAGEDVDGDGLEDLVVHFEGSLLLEEFPAGADEAELLFKGATHDRKNGFASFTRLRLTK